MKRVNVLVVGESQWLYQVLYVESVLRRTTNSYGNLTFSQETGAACWRKYTAPRPSCINSTSAVHAEVSSLSSLFLYSIPRNTLPSSFDSSVSVFYVTSRTYWLTTLRSYKQFSSKFAGKLLVQIECVKALPIFTI